MVVRAARLVGIDLAVCCALLLGLGPAPSAAQDVGESVTVTGTIVASQWDDDNNVSAVDLETDEGTYALVLNGSSLELLGLEGANVTVNGTLGENEYGWETITVASFSRVDAEEPIE